MYIIMTMHGPYYIVLSVPSIAYDILGCFYFYTIFSHLGGLIMDWSFGFVAQSILLGIGLAMDAFSVSLANGLNEPKMKKRKTCIIAGTFAFFQALMPMAGWVCVHTIAQYFIAFEKLIPWIALLLLVYIGSGMIMDAFKKDNGAGDTSAKLGFKALLLQGIATSIDALSVGFTISDYNWIMALVCSLIIAATTFVICFAGVIIGKKFGTWLSNKACILGGVILIFIGLEIFITGVFY